MRMRGFAQTSMISQAGCLERRSIVSATCVVYFRNAQSASMWRNNKDGLRELAAESDEVFSSKAWAEVSQENNSSCWIRAVVARGDVAVMQCTRYVEPRKRARHIDDKRGACRVRDMEVQIHACLQGRGIRQQLVCVRTTFREQRNSHIACLEPNPDMRCHARSLTVCTWGAQGNLYTVPRQRAERALSALSERVRVRVRYFGLLCHSADWGHREHSAICRRLGHP
ncbi:hypothetical protein GE09DRAFT_773598 [Coniochaeta sp. 2T2.1]|nr:hypothetical protein GE09DRAFT_773598 [Coniochaeta sp. 2T2.1]